MADSRIEKWIKGAVGRGMNLDRVYGFQCVDVVNDYGNYLFGNWERTVGRGNAKDKYGIMPSSHWLKIKNDPSNPKQLPKRGDVIVWPGWRANPVGHTAVVTAADKSGVTVIQQDGFTNTKPAHPARLPYFLGGNLPIGWLRPKLAPQVSDLDRVKAELKAVKAKLAKAEKTLLSTQAALKHSNASLDQAKLQYAIVGDLKERLEQQKAENDKLILKVDTLTKEKSDRDESVNTLWQSIGDFINKVLGK